MNPYDLLPKLPKLTVTSSTINDGQILGLAQLSGKFGVPGGKDISPALSWSQGPEGTKTYVVTCYDPEAPTLSGFWHWAVYNIPSDVTEIAEGAGDDHTLLPKSAITLSNDAGFKGFIGAAPPAGHGPHRYIFAVHACDAVLELPDEATPAILGFNLFSHAIARGYLTAIYAQLS